jgi:hypothetical protein
VGTALLLVLALPLFACAAYLFWLAMMARPLVAPAYPEPHLRFDLIVPAHDGRFEIEGTLRSLRAIDYPERKVRVIVVADAKDEATAKAAEPTDAVLLKLEDGEKDRALTRAFELVQRDGVADVVAVIEPESEVSPNLLRAFAARFEAGARCVQAELRVRNPNASKRAQTMKVAYAVVHTLQSLSRERLGLSVALRGSGMAIARSALERVRGSAAEVRARLAMEGQRVHYAHEAFVNADIPATEKTGAWDRERAPLALFGELAKLGLKKKERLILDVAADVVMPPLTILAMAIAVGALVSLSWASGHDAFPAYAWGLATYFLVFYVIRGWALSGVGVAALASFAYAPVLVAQHIALVARRRSGRKAAG